MSRPAEIDLSLARIRAARVDGVGLVVGRRPGPGDGWFAVEQLLTDDSAPATLLAMVRGISEVPADYIRGEWMFESYARAAANLGAGMIVAERRLPDLSPSNLLMAATGGLVAGTAVRSPAMLVLEQDPAEGSGLTRLGSRQDLSDAFHSGFTALIEPMVEWMTRHRLRQEKVLWTAAADRLAQSLLWCGAAFGKHDFAGELAADLLGRNGPLRIPLETSLDARGREHHSRVSCCLAYRAAGGSVCHGCPLNR